MIINHNMSALNTYRQLSSNNSATAKSLEKLSSGYRINRAGDDAAGLAISEKMRGQIRGLDMASKNAQDSVSLIQTAEGALNETHSILQRMRELAVQSSNDTNTDADRNQLQSEIKQLKTEIDRIGNTTEFNTKKLLEGSAKGVTEETAGSVTVNNNSALTVKLADASAGATLGKDVSIDGAYMVIRTAQSSSAFIATDFKVIGVDGKAAAAADFTLADGTITFAAAGAAATGNDIVFNLSDGTLKDLKVGDSVTFAFSKHEAASSSLSDSIITQIGANSGQIANISISDMRSAAIGVDKIDISSKFGAMTAIATIDVATAKVSAQRSSLGAVQNRLEHTINNLGTSSENLTAAESRIRDVDMAKEMMTFTKNNILQQAATAMLAQANQQPQGVLQLLR